MCTFYQLSRFLCSPSEDSDKGTAQQEPDSSLGCFAPVGDIALTKRVLSWLSRQEKRASLVLMEWVGLSLGILIAFR